MFELDCRSEGEDKPVKYPGIFHRSSLLILTKTDLLPHVEFDPKLALENGRKVHPEIEYMGNRHMRRILNQAANAAAKHKGSIFQILYGRYVPRLGHNQTIGIIAHKLCRLVWKILHRGIRYEERGPEVSKASKQKRTRKMIRQLSRLGYRIEPSPSQSAITA